MPEHLEARVALFGFPLGHSVSPAMHHAAARALGIALRYEPWQVDGPALAPAVACLREAEWLGANVTLPHKPAMLALVDGLSPLARRIGALNTVYKREGRLLGENTDAPALLRSLREQLDFRPAEERVVVLGAGGAARAAVLALAEAGVPEIGVWNRSADRAASLVSELGAVLEPAQARSMLAINGDLLPMALSRATLLINATSVGLDGVRSPLPPAPLAAAARIYDLVYGPQETPLVHEARAKGHQAVDGLWMLVYQAAAAFELWTGRQPPEQPMHDAALGALRARLAAPAPAEAGPGESRS